MQFSKKTIISHLLDSKQELLPFIFDPPASTKLRDYPNVIAFDSWELNQEKQILVRAALDIWNAEGNVFLWELLNGLSRGNFLQLILALMKWHDLQIHAGKLEAHSNKPQIYG